MRSISVRRTKLQEQHDLSFAIGKEYYFLMIVSKERKRPNESSEESMKANSCHSGAIMKNNRKESNKEKDKGISKLRSPFENTFAEVSA
jgi:hypothetical protein